MTHDWSTTTLGEFAPFTYGKGLSKKQRNETGDIPVYGSNGIIGYHDQALTKSPTIIIGRKGTVGAVHYSPGPCWPIDTTFYVADDDPELLRFKYYAFQSLGLDDANSDSAVPGLNRDFAHSIRLSVPPMEEQRRIAGVLGCLDDKIELNRRMAETLEQMARALFRSWFVDFEPVRAKQKARWRPGQSLPGLLAHLYDSFPDHLAPSEQGPIPAGWRVAALDEIATFLNGLALQKFPAQGAESIPAIKIAQLRAGHTDRADPVSPDIPSQFHVNDGDILFSWSGSLELVVWASGQGALNQHLFKVGPIGLPKWFVYHWVEQHLPEFRQIAADKATTMGHIKRHHLSDAQVVVPPSDALALLGATSAALFDDALCARVEVRTLAALRDTLLPTLMSAGNSQAARMSNGRG